MAFLKWFLKWILALVMFPICLFGGMALGVWVWRTGELDEDSWLGATIGFLTGIWVFYKFLTWFYEDELDSQGDDEWR